MIKKYLNIGCGGKFHKDWTNIDIVSFSPEVKSFNILKGIPFSENTFEAVYHSQVLEHIPTDKLDFLSLNVSEYSNPAVLFVFLHQIWKVLPNYTSNGWIII